MRITRIAFIIGAEKRTNFSGMFFAIVLGEISPKIRTTSVNAMVETVAARSGLLFSKPVKKRVPSEAEMQVDADKALLRKKQEENAN